MSNEMPAVLVGLVHFHDCPFVNEGLLFFGKSVRSLELSGTKKAVIISKTLNCALSVLTSGFLMESIRDGAEFLSDYFKRYARCFEVLWIDP